MRRHNPKPAVTSVSHSRQPASQSLVSHPVPAPAESADTSATHSCCDLVTWACGFFWCRCACGCRRCRRPLPVIVAEPAAQPPPENTQAPSSDVLRARRRLAARVYFTGGG